MSTRDDARLTAQERAALSSLEAHATADDPQLAARLRGPGRWTLGGYLERLQPLAHRVRVPGWASSLWFALPIMVVGLGLAVLSISIGWELGVWGAFLAAAGLGSLVRQTGRKLGPSNGSG